MKSETPAEIKQLESVMDPNTIPELTRFAEFIEYSTCRNRGAGKDGECYLTRFPSCPTPEPSEMKAETQQYQKQVEISELKTQTKNRALFPEDHSENKRSQS